LEIFFIAIFLRKPEVDLFVAFKAVHRTFIKTNCSSN